MSSQKTAPLFIITSNILNSRPPPSIVTLMLGKNDRQAIKDLNWAQSSRGYDGRVLGRGFREHLGHLWGKSPWVIFGGGGLLLWIMYTLCARSTSSADEKSKGMQTARALIRVLGGTWARGTQNKHGFETERWRGCMFVYAENSSWIQEYMMSFMSKQREWSQGLKWFSDLWRSREADIKMISLKKKSNWWTHSSNWILIFIERLKRPSIKSFNFRAALINIFTYYNGSNVSNPQSFNQQVPSVLWSVFSDF